MDKEPLKQKRNLDPTQAEQLRTQYDALVALEQQVGPFTEATEVRQDADSPEWSPEEVEAVYAVAEQLGFGAKEDVPSGTEGAVAVLEGGLAWKILAEVSAVDKEGAYGSKVFAGSSARTLREDEITFLADRDISATSETTEFEMTEMIARAQDDFVPYEQPQVVPFGYEVDRQGVTKTFEPTGQLTIIGNMNGRPVSLLRIDREYYTDEDGNQKYRQPQPDEIMQLLSDVLRIENDVDTPVAFYTSNTYASRVPSAIEAGLQEGRTFAVGMYGRDTLKEVTGKDKPQTPLNQLPGDLRIYRERLQELLSE